MKITAQDLMDSVAQQEAVKDDQRTKVIHTIPPKESYPKDLFPFIPIRLLPMSKLSDIGQYIDWIQVQQQVSHDIMTQCFTETILGLQKILSVGFARNLDIMD